MAKYSKKFISKRSFNICYILEIFMEIITLREKIFSMFE